MAVFFDKYLLKRRDINAKVRAMNYRSNVKITRNILSAWAEHVWAIMPIKGTHAPYILNTHYIYVYICMYIYIYIYIYIVNQRQRAYFIAVRSERRFLARVLQEYFKAIRRLRGTYSEKCFM